MSIRRCRSLCVVGCLLLLGLCRLCCRLSRVFIDLWASVDLYDDFFFFFRVSYLNLLLLLGWVWRYDSIAI